MRSLQAASPLSACAICVCGHLLPGGPAHAGQTPLALCALLQSGWRQASSEPTGITGLTSGPADVAIPPGTPEGQDLRYGLGFPFQVAPRKAGLFVNLRMEGIPVGDFENGTDVILFEDLSAISGTGAIPISRNETEPDPETPRGRIIVKYPMIGGFVPLGARRTDGSPHPNAGTGFGLCQAISFPVNEAGHFTWQTARIHRVEVHQFTCDRARFEARRMAQDPDQAHPAVGDSGWTIVCPGITNAIPDDDDMLQAVQATKEGATAVGVVRWQRQDGLWAPVSFAPAATGGAWTEPSLVRDTDGALLFSTRGYGADKINLVRVWRSADNGESWELAIDAPDTRHEAPISINQAADGTPYIAANLLGKGRESLCLWPLKADRSGLESPMAIRDARAGFGAPPGGSTWMVDHPSGAVLQLADGKWHNVLVYRILGLAEHRGGDPPPQTGCYVEEVLSAGEPIPTWRFE